MVWYTPQTFPKSGLSEVMTTGNEFQLKSVNSGVFNNLTFPIITEACPNLKSNLPSESSVVTKPPTTNTSKPGSQPVGNIPDVNGKSTTSVADEDLIIPDGFSPNGDGVNDIFVLQNKRGIKISLQIHNVMEDWYIAILTK
ncbi:MAG: hypothetical protein R2822_12545 [Spirosomataceae bacterium]